MAIPTSNNGSTFYNLNQCRSFNQPVTTSLVALSSQPCGEVIVINKTGQTIYLYDGGYTDDSNRLSLVDAESITLRGLTNAEQVSAKTATGAGTLYFRTQFFSNNPSQ